MRPRMIVGKLLLVATALASAPLSAQQGTAGPEARALMEAAFSESALQEQEPRDRLVSTAAAYCRKLAADLPTNSPSEDKWLRSELDGGSERMTRAIRSPEWSRLMAANFVSGCNLYSTVYENDKAVGLAGLTQVFAKYAPDLADFERMTQTKLEHLSLGAVKFHTASLAFASLMQSTVKKEEGGAKE